MQPETVCDSLNSDSWVSVCVCVCVCVCGYHSESPWGTDMVDWECIPDTVPASLGSDKAL